MRILHYMAGPCNGGVASLVYDLSYDYVKKGHLVDILSSRIDDKYFKSIEKYKVLGINIYWCPSKNNIIKNILYLKDIMMSYDVVHVHLFPHQLYAAIAYQLIPEKKRPIFITTEHNTWNNRRKFPILRYLDRWFYKRYDSIISISNQTETNLRDWLRSDIFEKNILTINNGININKFQNAKNKLSNALQIIPNVKYVVMVARMVHPKDPVTIVKALAKCNPCIHAIFIGNGYLENDICLTAKKLGIKDRIHLLGARDNVPELLKGCDLGILSTHWDGFGLVAAEYMAAGIPVIATDVDGLRDVVGNKKYLFTVGDYDVLANMIEKILLGENEYQKAIDYFNHQVLYFSSERMSSEYLQVYDNLKRN